MPTRNLVGQQFGKLTVLADTGERFHESIIWSCRCECGNEINSPTMYLKSGAVSSCKECRGSRHKISDEDMEGRQYGELTIIKRSKREPVHGTRWWECQCSCGKVCEVLESRLKNGGTRSCGHILRADIKGQRFGRLVADHPLEGATNKSGQKGWLCRCDCGGVKIVLAGSLRAGNNKSCGCLHTKSGKSSVRCPSCGKRFQIALTGDLTPQFCPECTPKLAGRSWRVCPICKQLFPAPPSSNAVTCSRECASAWKTVTHTGIVNRWSEESKAQLSRRGQTSNLQLGTAAAQKSPVSGRFETNQEAKIWTLIDPSGNEIVVRNLLLWARENTELFGKPPGDQSATQIAAGFRAVAQTMAGHRGVPGKRSGALTYFGWSLKCLPTCPEE